MNCNEFQHWLLTRDVFSNETPDALFHIKTCDACKSLYIMDTGLEKDILSGLIRQELPKDLMGRIDTAIDQAKAPLRLNKTSLAALTAGIALMVIFSFFMVLPAKPFRYQTLQQLSEKAVLNHLKANTAMSFTADKTEEALVMLRKELGFDVVIPDLSKKGYILIGGRACFLDTCRIAYLFYKKAETTSSLFILSNDHLDFEMPDGMKFSQDINEHHADIWKENGQVYAMVSSS
jgi:anti-sigma factor RsiW